MTKFYIAGPWENGPAFRPVRQAIEDAGHKVVSTWIDERPQPATWSQESWEWECALSDLAELKLADILLLCTLYGPGRTGAAVEFGYVLGRNAFLDPQQEVYIVGPETSVFHRLRTKAFPNWGAFLQWLNNPETSEQEESIAYNNGPSKPDGIGQQERP